MLGLIPIQVRGASFDVRTRTSFDPNSLRNGASSVCASPASRPARASSSLLAVERVPHRQLAHPILEEYSDAIVLWRRALRHAMRARRLGKRPRCPVPGLNSRDILRDRGHLSVTSSEGLTREALASSVLGERPVRS